MANGLDRKRLLQQIKAIDKLNGKLDDIVILKSIELDILEDGSLDLPDSVLKELDLTVCSVHYKFNLSRQQRTERILRAMDNPFFNIFAHPTGRLINEREPYQVDLEKIMQGALERGCFLELNANPDRLDLTDDACKLAKDMGLKVSIATDAHRTSDLDYLRLGIDQARRGWLEKQERHQHPLVEATENPVEQGVNAPAAKARWLRLTAKSRIDAPAGRCPQGCRLRGNRKALCL